MSIAALSFKYGARPEIRVTINDDLNNVLETYIYGASSENYYAGGGNPPIEYEEALPSTAPVYSKSYVYAGNRLLSTVTRNRRTETTEFHHPDRLGTKLVTRTSGTTASSAPGVATDSSFPQANEHVVHYPALNIRKQKRFPGPF